jgi:hypothetical protein
MTKGHAKIEILINFFLKIELLHGFSEEHSEGNCAADEESQGSYPA